MSSSSSQSSSDDSSDEEREVNLVLVQIYVETDDYLLKDETGVGVSMYLNRDAGKDERVFRDAVGPRETNGRIALGSPGGALAPERRAFAERFLAWQEKFGSGSAAGREGFVGGTRSEVPVFSESDFARGYRCSNRDDDDPVVEFPTPDNPSYFFSLLDDDYIVVEFCGDGGVSGTTLPEHRRFEVLDYDEAIHWGGEEGYDPRSLRRPPLLDTSEEARYLELPGHYTNHACGEAATAYDTHRLRGRDDGDDSSRGDGELVAPAMSAEYNAQLRDRTVHGVEPAPGTPLDDAPNAMMTHRAMKRGEEILTDYGLWHWSNEHYAAGAKVINDDDLDWSELSPDVQDAATSLGITGDMWDHGDDITDLNYTPFEQLSPSEQECAKTVGYTPEAWNNVLEDLKPWFDCLCGDSKCHSKDGFRGVKYFDLAEQKRGYWLYDPYMRQQIDWKVYQNTELEGGG